MKTFSFMRLMVFLGTLGPGIAGATVVDSSSVGFTVKFESRSNLIPDTLYTVFHRDIDQWWDPEHTWSGSAANLSIQPFPNGCFCEKLDRGGNIQHMNVIYTMPGKIIRMEGGLGPLQQFAVNGVLTFEIARSGADTKISLTYAVGGYIPGGAAKFAAIVDQVIGIQFKRYIDLLSFRN